MNKHVRVWPLQEAKAKFSELVRLAQSEGPQTVTVHGEPAVIVSRAPAAEKSLADLSGPDLIKALRKGPLFDLELPDADTTGSFED
jgi:antitoxin Phd